MPPSHLQEHVETIAKQEQEFLERRTTSERFGDAVAGVVGTMTFVVAQVLVVAAWMAVNTLRVPGVRRFDPYPFQLLGCCLGVEAILLASFILMRQTGLGRRAEERDHLMLQVLLLSEKEITAVVQMNQQIADKVGLPHVAEDEEIKELGEKTSIDEVAQTIQETLTNEG